MSEETDPVPCEEIETNDSAMALRRRCPCGTVFVLGVIPGTEIPAYVCPKCGYFELA